MKTETQANQAMNEQAQVIATERARWAAVLTPKARNREAEYAAHYIRGKAQGFRPLGRFQWLAMSMIASAGPR